MDCTVAFDFEDVLPTVQRAHSLANRDDAEEAVQTAVAEMLEKGEPLTSAFVIFKARSRLMNALRRRERKNASLDSYLEDNVDEAPIELAIDEVDYDAHARLREAGDNPILRRRLEASRSGAPELRRRGAAATTRGRVYPDEVVAEARQLRRSGLTYSEIAKRLGAGESTVGNWCSGRIRKAPTANPGWTRELAIEAIRAVVAEDGKQPTASQMNLDPRLPDGKTFYRLFDSWSEALEAAEV
jgi:DNA-directed RNA polymerase specialized sigma24 family protein